MLVQRMNRLLRGNVTEEGENGYGEGISCGG